MMALPLEICLVRELRAVTEDIQRIGDDVCHHSIWVGRTTRVLRYHVSLRNKQGNLFFDEFSTSPMC
jgi:hypothetical protein